VVSRYGGDVVSESGARFLGRFKNRKAALAIATVATLLLTSALAVVALSEQNSSNKVKELRILSISHDPDSAYEDQLVAWTVQVSISDKVNNGKHANSLLFTWDWGDGNSTVHQMKLPGWNSTATDVQTHTWAEPGAYEVVVSVHDGNAAERNKFHGASQIITFMVKPTPAPTPHDPISIDGDLDFATTAASESWPGSGTEYDPYIIELYEITGGDTEKAISVKNTNVHFIIRDCRFSDGYASAVYMFNVAHASVEDNVFTSCEFYSIYFEQCKFISMDRNTVTGGSHCVGIIDSNTVSAENNTVENAIWWPVWVSSSHDVILRGNDFSGSGIAISGSDVSQWNTHDIDSSNKVNGAPLYYFKNCDGASVPADTGQVILANCTNMIVDCAAPSGITLGFSPDNTVTGTIASSVRNGISAHFSPRTTIDSADISNCTYGIEIWNSPGCMITDSVISKCGYGIWIQQSDMTSIFGNSILDSDWWGLLLYYSSSGEVRHNLIARNSIEGLGLSCADSNLIAGNDFVDNTRQVVVHWASMGNVWDDGYPSGGNYWSDYMGADENSGVYQTEPCSDGIGDTPYAVSTGNHDRYPMMEPCTSEQSEYAPHGPILIVGNSGFTPENGVISGSGTASDPYVIAGWDINASTATGLEIRSTTAYYILRDMRIHSGTAIQPYLHEGIKIESASNGRVESIEIYDNTMDLSIRSSSNIVIVNNEFTNDFSGAVYLMSCRSIEFYNNSFITSAGGIVVQSTSYVTAKGNSFNAGGFSLWGSSASDFDTHTITADNTVAGKPVIYIAHGHDIDLTGVQAAQVIVASSTRMTLSGLNPSNVEQGIILAYVSDSVVESCTLVSDLYNCAKLYYCTNVTLSGNLFSKCLYYAVETISSSLVTIRNNVVTECSYGIVIRFYSPETLIENNTATGNFAAVLLYQASGGVRVRYNNLSSNDIGIFMSGAIGSEVVGNRVSMNAHEGILLESGSTSNVFHHNYFISNAVQVAGETANANTWDDGYPSGGNYWDDCTGVDLFSGPNQDEEGADGICDEQYVVGSGSVDRYPLMPLIPHS
jgi:parallel beta-helix repeat protein